MSQVVICSEHYRYARFVSKNMFFIYRYDYFGIISFCYVSSGKMQIHAVFLILPILCNVVERGFLYTLANVGAHLCLMCF